MSERRPTQVGVRVEADDRDEIKAFAERHFAGNESHLFRESARLYMALRRKLGVQFEPFLADVVPEYFALPPATNGVEAREKVA